MLYVAFPLSSFLSPHRPLSVLLSGQLHPTPAHPRCLLDEALDDKLTKQKEFLFDPSDPMKIRPEKLRPMARLGGLSYARSIQSVPSILHICP